MIKIQQLYYRFHLVHGQEQKPEGIPPKTRQLPWLALNEVN